MKTSKFIISLSLLAFAACTPKNEFAISGSVEGDCDSVYFTGDHSDLIEAAVPVVDGRYQWEGTVDSVINIWVCKDRQHSQFCRAILEPGNIVVNIPAEGMDKVYPSGTPLNDSVADFERTFDELSERYSAIDEQLLRWLEFEEYVEKPVKNGQLSLDLLSVEVRDSLEHDITAEYDKLTVQENAVYREFMNLIVNSLCQNDDNAYGIYLLESYDNGFCNHSFYYEQLELLEESMMRLRKLFPKNYWTEYVVGRFERVMRTTVGRKYTDLTMHTPEWEVISLSDVIPHNKYTLIDFWASWCGPCMAGLPDLKEVYKVYHSEGLEIVSVSYDDDEEAWRQTIANENLSWLHMSDLKGWDTAARSVYGIQDIPFTLLVAQDGTIVASNLRGNRLMDKLSELMSFPVGSQYADLTMPTPEGTLLSLSDVIPNNKYTFIDFWASWCGPCRAELPNVKAAYAKYHSQGFEVVGISFDATEYAWRLALVEEDLPWFHMSDLKGWECAASDVYGIKAIPFTMLVAQDGTIVAKNLRGDELMKKLDELMGK